MMDEYEALLDSVRTRFYLDNGWQSAMIAEIVGRFEDEEDIAIEDFERIDCYIKELIGALKAILDIDNPPAGESGHVDFNVAIEMGRKAIALETKTG